MANKSVTITEPVANDVCRIVVNCDGNGNVTGFQTLVKAASDDGDTVHTQKYKIDPDNMTATEDSALSDLIDFALAEYKTAMGF